MYILQLLVILHLSLSMQIEAERKIFGGEIPPDTKAIPSIVKLTVFNEKYVAGKGISVNYCGGSYIRPNWVITAAHCISKQFPLTNHKAKFTILLCMGSIEISSGKCPKSLKRRAVEAHPYSDQKKYRDNDIMLIKVDKPWVLGPTIQIAKFPPPGVPLKFYNGKNCLIAGWGMTDTKHFTKSLKQGRVTIYVGNPKECWVPNRSKHICVKGDTAITCAGDSGGPLNCDGMLVGVLESGIGKCNSTKTKTSIFNSVEAYRDWIIRIAGEEPKVTKGIPSIVQITFFNEVRVKGKNFSTNTCGGSYIRPNWVLTAANCIKHQLPLKNHKAKFDVELCMGSIGFFKCPKPLTRLANKLYPRTNGNGWRDNDIMLIKVNKPWVLGPTIQIAKLPPPKIPLQYYNKKQCLIAGCATPGIYEFGKTLEQATVTLHGVNPDKCSVTHPSQRLYAKGGTATSCTGDSGGLLLCDGLLVGVLQSGQGKCNSTKTKTSVFNMVEEHQDWITSIAGATDEFAGAGYRIAPNKLCLCIFSVIALAIFN